MRKRRTGKKRKSSGKSVIHVTIHRNQNRSHSSNSLINSERSRTYNQSDVVSSSKPSVYQTQPNIWANSTDYAGKYQHLPNLKKKKSVHRYCLIVSSIVLFIFLSVMMIILLVVLLNRSKPKPKIIQNATLQWKPEGMTVAGTTNVFGTAANLLKSPDHVALDYLYSMYISDTWNHRIQKYVYGATSGVTVAGLSNGSYAKTPYTLCNPSHTVIDLSQNLYISDLENDRVQLWKMDGSYGQTVSGVVTGTYGNASNQLNAPYSTAYDSTTNILYACDYANSRIVSYRSGNTTGVVIAGGNNAGSNRNQLDLPVGLHFDKFTDSLIIVNYGNHNILRWKLGASNWTLLAGSSQGFGGAAADRLSSPVHMSLDPMGNIYVADRGNQRIQLFLNGQSNGITIAGKTGWVGSNSTLLRTPWAVTLDNQLNIYVADSANHRIQKFLRY